jgi:predicted anti-sigma-YlaC factor YlaD
MDCRELVELVTDFLEGALTDEQATAVREHVQECIDCLRYLGQLQLTTRLLGRLSVEGLEAGTA